MGGETETLTPALPDDLESRAAALMQALAQRDWRIATAESCTGGMLAAMLTDLPGVSHAFERGIVAYTEEAKRAMLGVPAAMLAEHGAVSRPVALAMAQGALDRSEADVALAITGFADQPDGEDGEAQAGLVHVALAHDEGATSHAVARLGAIGRGPVRLASLALALDLLGDVLNQTATSLDP